MAYLGIVWKTEYEVGIELIDEQHKKLVQIANTFLKARADGLQQDVLKNTLVSLIDYTKYHFKDEEELLKKNYYPELVSHSKLHEELIEQIIHVLERLKDGSNYAIEELTKLIKEWLIDHILQKDMEYKDYFAKNGRIE
ncbi:MAG: bacteriohemerythrin [Bacteroidetes bacterium]|nr:bacteriohemerythrin [Bacteroidota bacterium]